MANRSYLCASNVDTIYPSFVQKNYDPSSQLIASDVENVPLMWLALFREDDLRQEVFQVEGEDAPAYAPVCTKEKALRQLDQAIPYLSEIFPELGSLDEYGKTFRSALEQLPFQFITIELEEIDSLYPFEHRYEEQFRLGLRGFDHPHPIHFHCDNVVIDLSTMKISIQPMSESEQEEVDEEMREILKELQEPIDAPAGNKKVTIPGYTANSHAEILERLSGIKPTVRLPSVRTYLDDLPYEEDEQWNLTRVLGAGLHGSMGYGREVPWEKEDADFGIH